MPARAHVLCARSPSGRLPDSWFLLTEPGRPRSGFRARWIVSAPLELEYFDPSADADGRPVWTPHRMAILNCMAKGLGPGRSPHEVPTIAEGLFSFELGGSER